MAHRIALLVAATILSGAESAFACFMQQGSPSSWVSDADMIVRARVWRCPVRHSALCRVGGSVDTLGGGGGAQRRGSTHLRCQRNPCESPDMNNLPVPYDMVRPAAAKVDVSPTAIYETASTLLFLKKVNGKLTPTGPRLGRRMSRPAARTTRGWRGYANNSSPLLRPRRVIGWRRNAAD